MLTEKLNFDSPTLTVLNKIYVGRGAIAKAYIFKINYYQRHPFMWWIYHRKGAFGFKDSSMKLFTTIYKR